MPREVFEILYKTKGTDKTIRDTDKVDKKLGGIAQTAKRLAGPAALGAVAVGLFKVAQSAVKTAAELPILLGLSLLALQLSKYVLSVGF